MFQDFVDQLHVMMLVSLGLGHSKPFKERKVRPPEHPEGRCITWAHNDAYVCFCDVIQYQLGTCLAAYTKD